MTKEEKRELDRELIKVIGIPDNRVSHYEDKEVFSWVIDQSRPGCIKSIRGFNPSEKINDAFEVLDALRKKFFHIGVCFQLTEGSSPIMGFRAEITHLTKKIETVNLRAIEETRALAISVVCREAYKSLSEVEANRDWYKVIEKEGE